MKKLNLFIGLLLLASCSGNQNQNENSEDSTAVAEDVMDLDEVSTEEALDAKYKDVLDYVNEVYKQEFEEPYGEGNPRFSHEMDSIFSVGDKLGNGDMWGPDCGFLTLTQDYHDAKVKELHIEEVKNASTVVVKCVADLGEIYDKEWRNWTLHITMVKENGEWKFDDNSNGEFSFKQCCIDDIKMMKE